MKLLEKVVNVILDLIDKIENVENESWRKEMRQKSVGRNEA